jgi:predicted nucleic acid-binding protein
MAKRIYADSGIFIAHLNGEEQYSAECADILEAAQAGLVELHTSYVSMTEVLKRRTESLRRGPDDERTVSEFMDEDFIRYSALEAVVASYARYVVWDTRAQVRDAIHLATAMQRNCEVFYTTDTRLLPRSGFVNSRLRLPEIKLPEYLRDPQLPL